MIYRVFEDQAAADAANAAWSAARAAAGVYDIRNGQPINPGITCAWDTGRAMLDGRIACAAPGQWADEFGGEELELTDADFPQPERIK